MIEDYRFLLVDDCDSDGSDGSDSSDGDLDTRWIDEYEKKMIYDEYQLFLKNDLTNVRFEFYYLDHHRSSVEQIVPMKYSLKIPNQISQAELFSIIRSYQHIDKKYYNFHSLLFYSFDFQDNKGLNPSVEDSKKIKNIKYTIETLPIMDIFRPNPTYDVNGKYFIYELGKSKSLEKVNISLSIDFSKNISIQEATSLTKKYFNIIKSNYGYQGYIINNEQMSTFKYDKSEDIKYINYQSNLIRASNENDKPFLPGKVLK